MPQPVKAVLLLFPTGKAINQIRKEEETENSILSSGAEDEVLWIPQTVSSCGGSSLTLEGPALIGLAFTPSLSDWKRMW